YSSNIALQLAKTLKRNPRELAASLIAALEESPWVERAEVAGAGFINIFLSGAARRAVVTKILEEGDLYGRAVTPNSTKVMVEFVRAPRLRSRGDSQICRSGIATRAGRRSRRFWRAFRSILSRVLALHRRLGRQGGECACRQGSRLRARGRSVAQDDGFR